MAIEVECITRKGDIVLTLYFLSCKPFGGISDHHVTPLSFLCEIGIILDKHSARSSVLILLERVTLAERSMIYADYCEDYNSGGNNFCLIA